MKVIQLDIENFRGIRSATLRFDGHTLMVGPNNVGKSTLCEALDLVLGPDRVSRFPPVEEFDFYNATYLKPADEEGQEPVPVPLVIRVLLVELSAEVENRCGQHLEFWHVDDERVLDRGEAAAANPGTAMPCLRLETRGVYNPDEDEFEAQTYYSHSPNAEAGELDRVHKEVKRLFGFLYLRAVRTGSRALSLERGSLLDVILRLKGTRAGLWERTITRLRGLDIEQDAEQLQPVLRSIESRLAKYIATEAEGRSTRLHISQLTREHLRKTMAFFLAVSHGQSEVPFQQVGTGTLNVLVLALLSFIAELKDACVIFAMEEPEIALPPHTQRRIADYLLTKTTQAFVTSHSPFVIERFEPEQTVLLKRDEHATVSGMRLSDSSGLKGNDFRRYARRGLTECMLGRGAVVVEGLTEFHALPVVARKMEEADETLQPLDIAGVAFFDAESEGAMAKFGLFFRSLGLKAFAFYDHLPTRAPAKRQAITDAYDVDGEHAYAGIEALLVAEVSTDRMWAFLDALRVSGDAGHFAVPDVRPDDEGVRVLARQALQGSKGAGWAARLLEGCEVAELPATLTAFLTSVYAFFPKPAEDGGDEEGDVQDDDGAPNDDPFDV